MREYLLREISDLTEGQRKVVRVGKVEILVFRHNQKLIAIQSKCPHAGGPLEKGAICNGRIVCPWHMGTFKLPDGELVEPPAMESLKTFRIREQGGSVFVTLPHRTLPHKTPVSDRRKFLIVGCGAAGSMAAKTLRDRQFGGIIVVADPHSEEPIDRTMLTKMALSGGTHVSHLKLQDLEGLNLTRITAAVTRLQSDRREVVFSDGSKLRFDAALICTGGSPKLLPTNKGERVYVIRHTEDLQRLRSIARPKSHAAIIGTSFIGMETASALTQRGLKVTVLGREKLPFEKQFGPQIAKALLNLHRRKGVKFILGAEILQVTGRHVLVTGDGVKKRVDADLVVFGVGVEPYLGFDHDLPLAADGSVLTDRSLRANEHVWVAGDIANVDGIRIEHWRVAQQQGMAAAVQMLGGRKLFSGVPFFWTYHYGKRINYLGHATGWDQISKIGNLRRFDFIALFSKKGVVRAVISCARETETALLAELMRKPISVKDAKQAIRAIARNDFAKA